MQTGSGGGGGYSPEQLANAKAIVATGKQMGMSPRDIQIGLMTALDESSLLMYANSSVPSSLSYSHQAVGHDTDSLGLFQQRPSAGWGSISQLMTANYDAGKFFAALKQKGSRLTETPWAAAQSVQISGTPDGSNYQRYWSQAQGLYSAVNGTPAATGSTPSTPSAPSSNPVANMFGLGGQLSAVSVMATDLTSPAWWHRVGLFAGGGILTLIAVLYIVNKSGAVQSAVKVGAKVAKVAAVAA